MTGLLIGLLTGITAVEAAWFRNTEQEAARKYREGEYSEAAQEFSDGYRRGVALYRAGRYTDAGEAFASVEREDIKPDALYNLGNSRYKRGDYEGAVEAYQEALAMRPKDADTLHNLALAKQMLEETLHEELPQEETEEPPEEEQEEEQQEEQQQSEEEQQQEEESSGEQEQEQESEESSGEQEQ
ncbi:MAG: tetratricopeptide repeat protein, partial [Gammaproteobacteria bacterium]